MIIDANGAILGRLASKVSKKLLKGEKVVVLNSEKIVVSGNPKAIIARFKEKLDRGDPHKGPFYPKYPDRIFRRVVRGMLPYKKDKGAKAFRKLKVFVGNPENLEGKKIGKNVDDLRSKYITLNNLSKRLGAKLG